MNIDSGSTQSIKWWGCFNKISLVGFADPISQPLYTITESTLMISIGNELCRSIANDVFPEAVGPNKNTTVFFMLAELIVKELLR